MADFPNEELLIAKKFVGRGRGRPSKTAKPVAKSTKTAEEKYEAKLAALAKARAAKAAKNPKTKTTLAVRDEPFIPESARGEINQAVEQILGNWMANKGKKRARSGMTAAQEEKALVRASKALAPKKPRKARKPSSDAVKAERLENLALARAARTVTAKTPKAPTKKRVGKNSEMRAELQQANDLLGNFVKSEKKYLADNDLDSNSSYIDSLKAVKRIIKNVMSKI
jgi:hypothetical protein